MRSPLTISTDISRATAETLSTLGHDELIAVNQDPLPTPARLIERSQRQREGPAMTPTFDAWVGPLHDNCSVVLVVNLGSGALRQQLQFDADLQLSLETYRVRDMWGRQDLGVMRSGIDVEVQEAHDNALYKLCPPSVN